MKPEICNKCSIFNDGLYQLGVRKNICGAPRYVSNPGMPKILLSAEAFGKEEDLNNIPLIGRAGKLLDKLLEESGLNKFDLKLDNVVKCRPIKFENGKYKNRTPTDGEIECCRPYLEDTLSFNPDFIILLGAIPFKAFFPDKNPKEFRGKAIHYNHHGKDILTALFYHPAACLYNPSNKPILLRHLTNVAEYLKENQHKLDK